MPEQASTARITRVPTRRRATATAPERIANQVAEPTQTPARSGTGAKPATDAAEKIAAHDAIVIGFDAVAATDVAKARRGEATSSSASPPSRTRNALQSVRAPRNASAAAPARPSASRSASIWRSAVAPATQSAGYTGSITCEAAPL